MATTSTGGGEHVVGWTSLYRLPFMLAASDGPHYLFAQNYRKTRSFQQ